MNFLKKTATKYIHSLPPVLYPFDFAVGSNAPWIGLSAVDA